MQSSKAQSISSVRGDPDSVLHPCAQKPAMISISKPSLNVAMRLELQEGLALQPVSCSSTRDTFSSLIFVCHRPQKRQEVGSWHLWSFTDAGNKVKSWCPKPQAQEAPEVVPCLSLTLPVGCLRLLLCFHSSVSSSRVLESIYSLLRMEWSDTRECTHCSDRSA